MNARRLWAHPDARRYLTGQALSLFGDSAMWLACGIWVRALTGSNAAAAVTFVFFIAPALLAPLAGLLADRVRRRPLLVVANLAGAGVLTPLLLVHDRGTVWLVYAVMLLYGFLNVLIAPAQSALLATLLPGDLLADANAALRTVQEGLRVLAPLVGAGLFALLGGRAVAVLDMLTFVAAAGLVASLRLREPAPAPAGDTRWIHRIGAGFHFIATTKTLRRLTIASAVATVAVGFGDSTTYAIITEGLHRGPEFAGVTQMVQGFGAIAGGLAAAPLIRRMGETRAAVAGLVLLAAGYALVTAPVLAVVLLGKVCFGAALPGLVVAILTVLQRLSPTDLQGRVYAAFEVATTGPQTVGLGLGALCVATLDFRLMLAAVAVVLLVAAALLTRARPSTVDSSAGDQGSRYVEARS